MKKIKLAYGLKELAELVESWKGKVVMLAGNNLYCEIKNEVFRIESVRECEYKITNLTTKTIYAPRPYSTIEDFITKQFYKDRIEQLFGRI